MQTLCTPEEKRAELDPDQLDTSALVDDARRVRLGTGGRTARDFLQTNAGAFFCILVSHGAPLAAIQRLIIHVREAQAIIARRLADRKAANAAAASARPARAAEPARGRSLLHPLGT